MRCSGVYWLCLDYFSKAGSTLAVWGRAPSAELSGSKVGSSLALQLGLRTMGKGLPVFDWSHCALIRLKRKSILSRNTTFWRCLVSQTTLTYSLIFSCRMNFLFLPFSSGGRFFSLSLSLSLWFVLSFSLSSLILI